MNISNGSKSSTFHGLFLVNKEPGMTSHDVVGRMRRVLGTPAVGHCGTLDPLADGVLVLLAGEATKLSSYILEGDKSYQLEMQLGLSTDTLDITGQTLTEAKVEVTTPQVISRSEDFSGEKEWAVPLYSAVKVNGQKLYEYARKNQEIEPPKKKMKFWNVEFLRHEGNRIQFHLHCSKGSFIRTWVDEFGKSLGCGAALSRLTRTSSYPYHLEETQKIAEIEKDLNEGVSPRSFRALNRALPQSKTLRVSGKDEKLLLNGQISHDLRLRLIQSFDPQVDRVFLIVSQYSENPLALVGLEPEKGFIIRRVFQIHTSK